ncbi:hypothetical protein H109_00989 [Trichophyton interdigitale MR816]|uniref:Uncharacterized protein n=1 Tax=Trichophyton interdigitale (strain MR816) TaxID=1215338 RepID=A0A059JIF9_TRIIM|nr:hypothetical protein H101_02115 [Trichophyton interdigitale H6]KDB27237.1 hypothetical protein H109_00989 [Trichophyton interdigitale MR816]
MNRRPTQPSVYETSSSSHQISARPPIIGHGKLEKETRLASRGPITYFNEVDFCFLHEHRKHSNRLGFASGGCFIFCYISSSLSLKQSPDLPPDTLRAWCLCCR